MMRKDVRIGFAIGGVLLAVLIVYGLVTSGPAPRNHEVTLAPDDPAAASKNPKQSNPPAADKPQDAAAPQTAERSGGTDASAGNAPRGTGENASTGNGTTNGSVAANPVRPPTTAPADKWERALNNGVLMVHSETPALGSAGAQPNQDTTAAQPDAQPPQTPTATEGTTSGSAGTSGTNAGDLAGTNPADTGSKTAPPTESAPGTGSAANTGGGGTGTGAIDARVLADIAAGGSGTSTSAGNSSSGTASPTALSTTAGAGGQRTHVVQANETFASIAEMAYGSQAYYPHVVRANPSVNPKRLRAGMTIVLPDKEQVVAKDAKASQGQALATPPGGAGVSGTAGSSGATHLTTGPNGAGGGAVTVATTPIDEKTQYRVQAGESLYKISQKLYGRGDKVNAIYDANKDAIGPNRNQLKAGTVLKLPEPPATTGGATAAR